MPHTLTPHKLYFDHNLRAYGKRGMQRQKHEYATRVGAGQSGSHVLTGTAERMYHTHM